MVNLIINMKVYLGLICYNERGYYSGLVIGVKTVGALKNIIAVGATPLTYSGLSGVGDLIVTGTSIHSRNWRTGDLLGRGENIEYIERCMGMVIEGISTTKVAYELSQKLDVYMPITTAIYQVIY